MSKVIYVACDTEGCETPPESFYSGDIDLENFDVDNEFMKVTCNKCKEQK